MGGCEDGIVTRDGDEVMDSVCVGRVCTEQVCSMTNSQGEESKVDVTGVLDKVEWEGRSGINSVSLKTTCLEIYILWVVGSRQIYPLEKVG